MKQIQLFACFLAIIGWNLVAAFDSTQNNSRALAVLPKWSGISNWLDTSQLPGMSNFLNSSQLYALKNLTKLIVTTTKDVNKHVLSLDVIYNTYNEIMGLAPAVFDAKKQLIVGFPFEVLASTINFICSSLKYSNSIEPTVTPEIDKMQFQLRTACSIRSFPLREAEKILDCPEFDPTKKIVIFASGWSTTVNISENIVVLAKAYNCRNDTNFLAIDAAQYVDTLYTWAAFNTDKIGEYIAVGLQRLVQVVPLQNIHLIGHSLGAHIMGAAARYFYEETGRMIPRVTGLDPANPCFNEGEVVAGLQRGDADFVDIIHSNYGVLGLDRSVGDADFYPGGAVPLVPGCMTALCGHDRAWEYFAETVYPGSENGFMAKRCTSLKRLSRCRGSLVPMGYATPTNVKGNYFLNVNKNSPFGENTNPMRFVYYEKCGLCEFQ